MKIEHFEDLKIWQDARMLSSQIFELSLQDTFTRDYRFTSQIRASAGSIMDNIAEGFERSGNKEFIQFLYIAKGSCGETRSQLYRAFDCSFITEEQLHQLRDRSTLLSKEIGSLINYLRNTDYKGSKYTKG